MVRINVGDLAARWRFGCPDRARHSDWRVVDGLFECRSCGVTYEHIYDKAEEQYLHRSEVEVVGSQAGHKGAFGEPTVDD